MNFGGCKPLCVLSHYLARPLIELLCAFGLNPFDVAHF
jgi:hypothetical protein